VSAAHHPPPSFLGCVLAGQQHGLLPVDIDAPAYGGSFVDGCLVELGTAGTQRLYVPGRIPLLVGFLNRPLFLEPVEIGLGAGQLFADLEDLSFLRCYRNDKFARLDWRGYR
jgi:hypothetical protein